MLVKLMAVRPADIDETALRRNGTGTITVRPHGAEGDGVSDAAAYSVSADFFPAGIDVRNFRSLEGAMAFVVALVLAANDATRRFRVVQTTIEIQVEV
jgi:hypothetical protein